MTVNDSNIRQPKLGMQGSVIAWRDPWGHAGSDTYMRTGTGRIYPSQDPDPSPDAFMRKLKELGAEFYVHHVFPDLQDLDGLLRDATQHGIDLCLGNEYGNINGPWEPGTNRFDVPDRAILEAVRTGRLMGLLYDEPEHLQINAGQYRKDAWLPHWGICEGAQPSECADSLTAAVKDRVGHVRRLLESAGVSAAAVPLISEQVFPVLYHAQARGGMAVCPKVMKEEFQSLQLATALGAAKQYGRPMWICADLWGPDAGLWPIRTPGFPGHSPEEFASALRMGYAMGPTHLFTENIDVLLAHGDNGFKHTVFGDIWQQFAREYVPANRLDWTHADAEADIVLIHSDDSNYGQNARPFGNRDMAMPETTHSVFQIWNVLSHGTLPAHGNNMHIPGFKFPRHALKETVPAEQFPLAGGKDLGAAAPPMHPLFYPTRNVLVYDAHVTQERLGGASLIFVAGSHVSADTLQAVRRRAEQGATVLIADWLAPAEWREERSFAGGGLWLPTADFRSERTLELAAPHLGSADCWSQRFGDREVRMYKKDAAGFELDIEFA